MTTFFILLASLLVINGLLLLLSVNKRPKTASKANVLTYKPNEAKVYPLDASISKLKKAI